MSLNPLGAAPDPSSMDSIPSVEDRVEGSTEVWARDLRALFEHAKERFGDVSWESEEGLMGADRVWGHKAVIYARAPKAFKDRYFISRPFSRSPTSLRSPSPHHLPSLFPSRASSPPSSYRPSPLLQAGRSSSLSVNTVNTFRSDGTIRAGDDGVLRLTHGDTPELFHAQLEWLYTGEGFGDVVEWISAEDEPATGGSIRDSLGRRGNIHERRDKLGQDLTYMWRAKLYADVRIHLTPQDIPDSASDDSDDSIDSLSSTAIFTAHKFILASRSPYFASVLLNPGSFLPHSDDIHLPTPPFTPAALHFCLGYMYAGHLDFSNRTFDLLTAFQIHRAAAYLQLDTLIAEIEARIVYDFCHGLQWAKCHCRKCPIRAGRVWKFAAAPDVGAVVLAKKARTFVLRAWGQSWGREIGLAEDQDREGLVKDIIASIQPNNIGSAYRSMGMIKARMEAGLRAKGREAGPWVDNLESMLEPIHGHCRRLLVDDFGKIAESNDFWDLAIGKGFNDDLLEHIGNELVDCVSTAKGCVEGPRIYQALVSSVLLKVDPNTLQTALPARSRGRQQIEMMKDGVIGHIRRRWMTVRDGGGFDSLEHWALKEISDEIEISLEDLLSMVPSTPKKIARFDPTPSQSRPSVKTTMTRTTTYGNVSDAASVRSTTSRATAASRPSTVRAIASENASATPPDATGLKRLRLSSSASTNSVGSSRSITRPPAPTASSSTTEPRARSPTAARHSTVTIGSARRPRESDPTPSAKPPPRSISGPPRQLMARGSTPKTTPEIKSDGRMPSPGPTPSTHSLSSVRTTRTEKSSATVKSKMPPVKSAVAEAGPSRMRTTSAATVSSVRSKAPIRPVPVPTNAKDVKDAKTNPNGLRAISNPIDAVSRTARSESGLRARTSSASTTTSVRSKAPSIISNAPSTASKAPTTTSRTPTIPTRNVPTKPPLPKSTLSNSRVPAKPTTPQSAGRASQPTSASSAASSSPRIRTTSTLSTVSRARLVPTAFPANNISKARSPSSSTDDAPEARTPRQSLLPALEPTIRRDGSDGSDILAGPSVPSSPIKLPALPPVSIAMPRAQRKVSSSSTRSTSSILRPHPASAFDPPRKPEVVALPTKEVPEGCIPFIGKGVQLRVGIPCIVSLHSKRARFRAAIKYIGHMQGSRGPWVGLEVDDLDRLGVHTLPSGIKDRVHYFHLSDPTPDHDENRSARQRKIEIMRDSLRPNQKLKGLGLGNGLMADPLGFGMGSGRGRSISPNLFADFAPGFESPRALFVRPSEVVFVMGAESLS